MTRALATRFSRGLFVASFAVACGEVYADPVVTPFAFGFGGADAGPLTSPRIAPLPCPLEARANGPCSRAGTVCEYGSSADPDCNELYVCHALGTYGLGWEEQRPPTSCPACPASETIVDGAPCSVPADGGTADEAELQCSTATAICACTTGRDGARAHPRKWVCKAREGLCPAKRPLLGQPCSGQKGCDYGACDFKRGSQMICEDDVWQTELASCK